MLTTNLCVPFGLFNWATGTIIDLIYKNENRPEKICFLRQPQQLQSIFLSTGTIGTIFGFSSMKGGPL
jgi:hypothetical protein